MNSLTDWIGTDSGGGVFQSLIDQVQQTGNAVYLLLATLCVAVMLVMIVIAAIKIMAGGQRGREDGKMDLMWILIGGLVLFSAVGLIACISKIGGSINDNLQSDGMITLVNGLLMR